MKTVGNLLSYGSFLVGSWQLCYRATQGISNRRKQWLTDLWNDGVLDSAGINSQATADLPAV